MGLQGWLRGRRGRPKGTGLPEMSLRYALNSEAKAEDVAALRESVGWEGRADKYRAIIASSFCYASCFDGQDMVGFARAISDGIDDAVIFDLAVAKSHRHRGIASQLVDTIIAYCAEQGLKAVCVLYEPQLARFYRKRGFLQICGGVIDTELMRGPWRDLGRD